MAGTEGDETTAQFGMERGRWQWNRMMRVIPAISTISIFLRTKGRGMIVLWIPITPIVKIGVSCYDELMIDSPAE